nr:unnamed protein product [Digitaria exilis]
MDGWMKALCRAECGSLPLLYALCRAECGSLPARSLAGTSHLDQHHVCRIHPTSSELQKYTCMRVGVWPAIHARTFQESKDPTLQCELRHEDVTMRMAPKKPLHSMTGRPLLDPRGLASKHRLRWWTRA